MEETRQCGLCGDEGKYVNMKITVLTGTPGEQKVMICNDGLACRRRTWVKIRELQHLANVAIDQVEN